MAVVNNIAVSGMPNSCYDWNYDGVFKPSSLWAWSLSMIILTADTLKYTNIPVAINIIEKSKMPFFEWNHSEEVNLKTKIINKNWVITNYVKIRPQQSKSARGSKLINQLDDNYLWISLEGSQKRTLDLY